MNSSKSHLPIQRLFELWKEFHFAELNKIHLQQADILPVIEKLSHHSSISVKNIGMSVQGREISRLTIGHGPLTILAWTQMHGNEPTATAAVLDWLHLLVNHNALMAESNWENSITLHVIPMLNPDGAQANTRVNAQGIDINRDAKALQSPEGKLLQAQVAELNPAIAFNLHDQNSYYSAGNSDQPATIAFLAPAFNEEKHVDAPRMRAKQLISEMTHHLRHWLPEQIGRYDDTYSYRSFGDNIAASGASTILIESGAARNDSNRQQARGMNVVALHAALLSLLHNTYSQRSMAEYYAIPENKDSGLTDLKLNGVGLQNQSTEYVADIAIKTTNDSSTAEIVEMGDLSSTAGFQEIDASSLSALPIKGYNVENHSIIDDKTYVDILQKGYCYLICNGDMPKITTQLPIWFESSTLAFSVLKLNQPAYFVLADQHGKPAFAVLNGNYVSI